MVFYSALIQPLLHISVWFSHKFDARYWKRACIRLSACLSVNRASFRHWEHPLTSSVTPCLLNVGSTSKNKDTSICNFVPNSGLRKFYHGPSIVATCRQRGSTKVDASTINQRPSSVELSWQYLLRSTFGRRAWPVCCTKSLPLCTAQCQWGSAARGSICDSWYLC